MNISGLTMKERLINALDELRLSSKDANTRKEALELMAFIEELDIDLFFVCAYCLEEKPYPPAEEHVTFEYDSTKTDGPVCSNCVSLLDDYLEKNAN